MIKISKKDPHIAELKMKKEAKIASVGQAQNEIYKPIENRPEVVDAKVYKLKSAFVKNSVFITLSYLKFENHCRPVEIFINSKDLTRAPEYVVLTRLISAIFRRSSDPMFILEELQGIYDPSGGSFKEGKYYHSFYAEIADVIERFFFDVKILDKPIQHPIEDNGSVTQKDEPIQNTNSNELNSPFRICPDCNNPTLKMENGCDNCVEPECGYSKCDK
ncbi:MAG: hypothetical protein H8E60_02375 [Candidatus Marinimicrobia bacterium]|nr:hypothetical protein [Candidatus Neomarinimicrobiota bacterium]